MMDAEYRGKERDGQEEEEDKRDDEEKKEGR